MNQDIEQAAASIKGAAHIVAKVADRESEPEASMLREMALEIMRGASVLDILSVSL